MLLKNPNVLKETDLALFLDNGLAIYKWHNVGLRDKE